jgi:hypothetical protein
MRDAVGTLDYRQMVTTAKGLKAASRFLIKSGLLGQFSLANTLLYGVG